MANKAQIERRKRELIVQLAESRQSITRGRIELKKKFQVKSLLQRLIANKPKSLFTGSAIAGLGTALLLRRPRKNNKGNHTTRTILFSWLLTLVKPAATAWLVARAKHAAAQQGIHPSGSETPQQ